MLIKEKCPECGATNEIDTSHELAFCVQCGAVIPFGGRTTPRSEATSFADDPLNSKKVNRDVNFIADFISSDQNAKMTLSFSNSRTKKVIPAGKTGTMNLPKGRCVVDFDIAGRSYRREIFITDDEPVIVHASSYGRREIIIEQPAYDIEEPIEEKPKQSTSETVIEKPKETKIVEPESQKQETLGKPSGLSIAAFVLSLTFIASLVGFVLGLIALTTGKKRNPIFAILAMVISFMMIMIFFAVIIYSPGDISSFLEESSQISSSLLKMWY